MFSVMPAGITSLIESIAYILVCNMILSADSDIQPSTHPTSVTTL